MLTMPPSYTVASFSFMGQLSRFKNSSDVMLAISLGSVMMNVFLRSSSLSLWHSASSSGTSRNGLSLSHSYCRCCNVPIFGLSFTRLLKLRSSLTKFTRVKTSGKTASKFSWFKCKLCVFFAIVRRVLISLCYALFLFVARSLFAWKSAFICIFTCYK